MAIPDNPIPEHRPNDEFQKAGERMNFGQRAVRDLVTNVLIVLALAAGIPVLHLLSDGAFFVRFPVALGEFGYLVGIAVGIGIGRVYARWSPSTLIELRDDIAWRVSHLLRRPPVIRRKA